MAALNIIKFRNYIEANHVMRGGIVGGPVSVTGIAGLVGATLTFTNPSGNKMFTQPAGSPSGVITFKDIKSQLEAAVANLKVELIADCIAFRHASGTAVTLGSANEPARTKLGMPNNTAINGKVYNPPGGAAPACSISTPVKGAVSTLSSRSDHDVRCSRP